ncbi:MAG: helix-turn-helix transcriptional regulator [Chloroflexota bacterium]|nr:helix-turn-helix transcriptional regulator [Chloroflexota bacterium]
MPGRRARRVLLKREALWDRLDRLNISQNELARRLGISTSHLSRLINGQRCPSPAVRRLLMEVLDCTEFDDLFYVVNGDA